MSGTRRIGRQKKAHSRAYNAANRETIKANKARYYQENKEVIKRKVKARKLGVSLEEIEALEQRTTCEICRKAFSSTTDQHIDHCHSTGVIRGVLCSGCNVGLGAFRDNAQALEAAANYLRRFQ